MTQENPKEFFSTNPPPPSGEGGGEGVKKKKILLVTRPICPPWDEASKNFAFQLAKNLPDFEFAVLSCRNLSDMPEHIVQKPVYTSNNFSFFQKIRLFCYLLTTKDSFDVIHCLFTPTKLNSFLLKTTLRKKFPRSKIIQTIATLREDLYSDHEIKKIMFGNIIITYSQYAKNKLNSLGFNNVKQIYPGIDLNYYSPTPKDKNLLNSYFLNLNSFIIAYPGEYSRLGATDDIVEMIIELYKQKSPFNPPFTKGEMPNPLPFLKGELERDFYKNIKFIFTCRVKNDLDKIKKQEVSDKLQRAGCLNNVIFTDTVSNMAELYNLSDVIIFPARDMKGKFDIPLALIEVMACGKPVILSDLAILKEFANENNSVIIENGDIEQLKNSILDLYQNKNKREEIGKNGRKCVEANFDIKIIADKYRKIYSEI